MLTIHQGNWEWMLHGATSHRLWHSHRPGVQAAAQHRPWTSLIYDIRSQFGSRPLSMEESTRDILQADGREFRVFVMVADQSPIRSERGYWTEFHEPGGLFLPGHRDPSPR